MTYFVGAHVSASGGVDNAPLNAAALGANAFALFTKNQRQWQAKPLDANEIARFKANCAAHGFTDAQILAHDSYLINLGHPDAAKRAQSVAAFTDELRRCEQLGIRLLNFHPGSHLGLTDEKNCLHLIAESINEALSQTESAVAVLENTAGQGTNLGHTFEQIADIIAQVNVPERVGVCIDTCHAFSAGYAFQTPELCEKTFAQFDRIIGYKLLRGMHVNDDMKDFASRVDRHAPLGEGTLGSAVFTHIMTHSAFENIPLILETPDDSRWADEIRSLRALQRISC